MNRKALLLVGSPKPGNSSSESLGDYLLEKLQLAGVEIEKIKINQVINSEAGKAKLIADTNTCDILIFSCPLYIDSTPASVIKAMEIIAREGNGRGTPTRRVMLAICNSGFPEAHQNHTALAIYRCFAKEAGFEWAGGLALGGGGSIDGRPLKSLGGMVRNIIKSLDLTAAAIIEGESIPEQAVKLMAKPIVPNWLYMLFGNLLWRGQAKQYGTQKKLNDRPYPTE